MDLLGSLNYRRREIWLAVLLLQIAAFFLFAPRNGVFLILARFCNKVFETGFQTLCRCDRRGTPLPDTEVDCFL